MPSPMLCRALPKAFPRAPVITASRAYTAVRVTPARRATTKASTPVKAPSSSKPPSPPPGRGNPSIVESLPNTADEIDIPPEVFSAQPESVPSSSVLRPQQGAPSPAAVAPAEFAESFNAGGSPADPSTPDWSKSYFGLSTQPFPKEVSDILLAPVDPKDVEMKPGASDFS